MHPLVGGFAPNSPSFRPCRARNENTNGRANARPPVFESNLSESRFSLLLPQQVFIQRQRLCMHLFGHVLAGFGRGGLFGLRRIGGGRRSPRPPENSAHMLHVGAVSKWLKQAMRGSAFFRNIFGQAKTECRKNGTQGIIFIRNSKWNEL